MERKPLAVGNVYIFPKHPENGFKISFISFPDSPHFDGGIPGVGVKWFGDYKGSFFYPYENEELFWKSYSFKDAVSK